MKFSKANILSKSNYGLLIYAHILRQTFPGETVFTVSGSNPIPIKNPFNNNESQMTLKKTDGIYHFSDDADSNFNGSPFDFAQKFYHLDGPELLEKIALDLNLIRSDELLNSESTPLSDIPSFSFYKKPISNIYPLETKTLVDIYYHIKNTVYLEETKKLRSISNTVDARKYKANNFDYVTFSGIFSKRNDKSLIKHSGLLTVDFDHVNNIPKLKETLFNDQYFNTELLFISPSGNGLKWIIPIDTTEVTHQDYFKAVANYLNHTYLIEADQSGKDISRACFLVHDPDVFINPNYLEDEK